ncbi:MAG: UDP-N-acetylglucosamine 1-carboxyvinyltransferase [Bacillota bacterium]
MSKYLIRGGNRLIGKVRISGAKNAALAIIAGCVLAQGETILENIPNITDVDVLLDIVSSLGARVEWLDQGRVKIEVPDNINCVAPYHKVKKLRASNLLLGSLLARRGQARLALPGGDNIGPRPMDLHLKGLQAMGATLDMKHGYILAQGKPLHGSKIYLDFPSVGATENIMMAACLAEGQTVIENVAKEPEVVDLANFLNALGGRVRGAGTDIIKIDGVPSLQGCRYSILPDRIEAGTFMVAAAITGGDVFLDNVITTHLHPMIAKLREAGAEIQEIDNGLRVIAGKTICPTDIKTLPYPGFPTDLQSQMMAMLSLAKGTSMITETVFENRLQVADELKRMGARIKVEGQTAVLIGVGSLFGAQVKASDLRAGAALVLAGLIAEGETEICRGEHIERGYELFEEKLRALGADITKVETESKYTGRNSLPR